MLITSTWFVNCQNNIPALISAWLGWWQTVHIDLHTKSWYHHWKEHRHNCHCHDQSNCYICWFLVLQLIYIILPRLCNDNLKIRKKENSDPVRWKTNPLCNRYVHISGHSFLVRKWYKRSPHALYFGICIFLLFTLRR